MHSPNGNFYCRKPMATVLSVRIPLPPTSAEGHRNEFSDSYIDPIQSLSKVPISRNFIDNVKWIHFLFSDSPETFSKYRKALDNLSARDWFYPIRSFHSLYYFSSNKSSAQPGYSGELAWKQSDCIVKYFGRRKTAGSIYLW